jgi:Cytochrome c7 and related cytochrome c/Class III cytochrome C family
MFRYVGAAVLTGLVATAWIVVLPPSPVDQPIAFPHAKHQGVTCTVCHRGAATTARAGIPGAAVCAKCHSTIPGRATTATAGREPPIAWVQVTHVPDHVMFSHRRHVTIAKLDCESCHGRIRDRTAPLGAAPMRLEMNTCLSCHSREGAAEDCAACHR